MFNSALNSQVAVNKTGRAILVWLLYQLVCIHEITNVSLVSTPAAEQCCSITAAPSPFGHNLRIRTNASIVLICFPTARYDDSGQEVSWLPVLFPEYLSHMKFGEHGPLCWSLQCSPAAQGMIIDYRATLCSLSVGMYLLVAGEINAKLGLGIWFWEANNKGGQSGKQESWIQSYGPKKLKHDNSKAESSHRLRMHTLRGSLTWALEYKLGKRGVDRIRKSRCW